jgi:hypothetical protein
VVFEFYTEDGVFKLEYADYLKRPDLMAKMQDKRRVFVNLGLRLFSFDRRWLSEHPTHCANSPDFDTEAHRFINDAENIYTAVLAGNRWGKTTIMMAKILTTYGLIPASREWEIFKDHGVVFREWTGPKEIALASYNWSNIGETIWPQVARVWTPKHELGPYSDYAAPKDTAFSVKLKCESIIHFKCMAQPQSAFESQALDGFGWDEQGVEAKVNGAEARIGQRRHYSTGPDGYEFITGGWHVCAATPHKVDGRPDTGGGTWFHKLYAGEITKGWTVKFRHGNLIDDVPDWIYPEAEKKRKLEALAEARRTNNKKEIRALESRIYGWFESTGGMVYDEYDDEVHVIDGIDIKPDWCAFRCMDHGRTNPTSCVWVAVTPENDLIAFQEYLAMDMVVSENVANIIRMSGNELEQIGEIKVGLGMLPRYRENTDGPEATQYIYDVLDPRTFRNPDSNSRYTIGDIYKHSGLTRIRPAPLQQIDATVPLMKEMLKIDPKRRHIITGKLGAPRLYFLRSGVPRLIMHMKNYRNREENRNGIPSEKPQSKDDHDLDALRYGVMNGPRYNPSRPWKPNKLQGTAGKGYWINEDEEKPKADRRRDRYTGY